jgi:hypothetical protein
MCTRNGEAEQDLDCSWVGKGKREVVTVENAENLIFDLK